MRRSTHRDDNDAALSDILEDVGVDNAQLLIAPGRPDARVTDIVILDSEDDAGAEAGALVLLVGARGRAALPKIRAITADRPTAIAVKGLAAELEAAGEVAASAGVALVAVQPGMRWDQFEAIARTRFAEQPRSAEETLSVSTDLFAIAQTTATLTRGHVVIEDATNRVLAYSPASDDLDELRKLSILALKGPERYQKLLKGLGVYKDLQHTLVPIRVGENPAEGLRQRVAIAIRAGGRVLGYLWLQEGKEPLAEQTDRILVGSARRAAVEMVRYRNEQTQSMRRDRIAGLLSDRTQAHSQARSAGLDPVKPAVLVLLSMEGSGRSSAGMQLRRGELANLASIHAAAYKANAVVGLLEPDIGVVLPEADARTTGAVRSLVEDIVKDARAHLDLPVQAAIGPVADRLDMLHSTLEHVRGILKIAKRDPAREVCTFAEVEATVLVDELFELLRARSGIRHAGVWRLQKEHPEFAETLLCYLDVFGDVQRCGEILGVHKNTVHYRLRRSCEVAGISLHEPDQRLAAHLQLRLMSRQR